MQFIYLAILLVLVSVNNSFAVPSAPGSFFVPGQQEKHEIRNIGDEHGHFFQEVATGFPVQFVPSSDRWEYSIQNPAGHLLPSGYPLGTFPTPAGISPLHRPPSSLAAHKSSDNLSLSLSPSATLDYTTSSQTSYTTDALTLNTSLSSTTTVTRPVLVILLNFLDATISTSSSDWSTSFFDTTPGAISIYNYFKDNSYGKFTITPATHYQSNMPPGVVSVNLSSNYASLTNYSFTVTQAISYLLSSGDISLNTLLSYDVNNDSELTSDEITLFLVKPVYEASYQGSLTPSQWSSFLNLPVALNYPLSFKGFIMAGEKDLDGNKVPLGVHTHELGHSLLNLPDLYDSTSTNAGLGNWSLMSSGSWGHLPINPIASMPVALDAWSRQRLHWSEAFVSNNSLVLLGPSLASPNNMVFVPKTVFPLSEYWLIENRVPSSWDRVLLGLPQFDDFISGLLVMHILGTSNSTDTLSNYNAYVPGSHQRVVISHPNISYPHPDCLLNSLNYRGCSENLFTPPGQDPFYLTSYDLAFSTPFNVASSYSSGGIPFSVSPVLTARLYSADNSTYINFSSLEYIASITFFGPMPIRAQNAIYNGDILISHEMEWNLTGGYNDIYSEIVGQTTINGSVTIANGSLTASNIIIGLN